MRKRIISLMLAALMLGLTGANAAGAQDEAGSITPAAVGAAASKTAYVSKMEILLDGEVVKPAGYLISQGAVGAYTYFKLRDIAYLMKDKECKFGVDFKKGTILLTRGANYTADGSEMKAIKGGNQKTVASSIPVLIDGKQAEMEAFIINGFTYYKLRDIGENLGFEVDYRNQSQQGVMKTPGYVEPEPEPEPENPNKPDENDKPGSNDKPDNNDKPSSTDKPSNNDKPNNTDKPGNTDKPSSNDKPSNTDKPNNTDKPSSGDKPSNTDKPNNTDKPGNTDKPDDPENPDKPDEPEGPDLTAHLDGVLTVLIDVGHGGTDNGSDGIAPKDFTNYKGKEIKEGDEIYEKDFNLPVALYLRDMLKASGVTVHMVRDSDKTIDLIDRKDIIESYAETADLCFSVHHNAFNSNAVGFEVLAQVQYKDGGDGKDFGAIIEKHYFKNKRVRHRPTVFREGQNGDYYGILRYAANVGMLAVISEYAFIDNTEDVLCVLTDEGLRAEAQAMHDSIMEYFSTHEY